jgi:hypothetical protein
MSLDIFPPLPLPVPPMLEAALGYEGTAWRGGMEHSHG